MKFEKLYPQAAKPPSLMGPNKDIYITETLVQTWRLYTCSMCKDRTGWRDISQGVSVCVCSEECLKALALQMAEMLMEKEMEVVPKVETDLKQTEEPRDS